MYNKRATETRHCIHMLGYSMLQYTCTTRGPQRLDTASTCWATAWYNIHVQQEGHRDLTLHPCTTRGPLRLDTASICLATAWCSFGYLVVTDNTQTHKLLEIILHYSVRWCSGPLQFLMVQILCHSMMTVLVMRTSMVSHSLVEAVR